MARWSPANTRVHAARRPRAHRPSFRRSSGRARSRRACSADGVDAVRCRAHRPVARSPAPAAPRSRSVRCVCAAAALAATQRPEIASQANRGLARRRCHDMARGCVRLRSSRLVMAVLLGSARRGSPDHAHPSQAACQPAAVARSESIQGLGAVTAWTEPPCVVAYRRLWPRRSTAGGGAQPACPTNPQLAHAPAQGAGVDAERGVRHRARLR